MVEGAYACGQCWHGREAACGEETTSECDQNEGLHAFFVSVAVLGFVLVSGSKLADWIWHVLDAAMIGAALMLGVFQATSFFVERSLCPYCVVVWFVTIPLIVNVLARSAQTHQPWAGRSRFTISPTQQD